MAFSIKFGREGNSGDHTVDGWSWPEDGFTWMTGSHSRLKLPDLRGPLNIIIYAAPFLHRIRPVQRLQVLINDIKFGQVEFESIAEGGRVIFEIPDGVLGADGKDELTLYHPDFVVPMEITDSGDWRPISLSLFEMIFESVEKSTNVSQGKAISTAADGRAQIAGRFESLGYNCEFGLFQRRCGIDPLGLLRLAGINLDQLLRMIRADFDGVGDPSKLSTHLSDSNEYLIDHLDYEFNFHTFITAQESTPEKVLAQQGRRLAFLVRKLREDIQDGEKIFVFHQEGVDLAQVEELNSLLKSIGPAKLLWVGLADENNPSGSVLRYESGLLHGRIGKFSPLANMSTIDADAWEKVCVNTWMLEYPD
ncbi:MAG: hypothetical protein PW843_07680 [Azospirillaceae bacterium]|nr:hypothetical protein [Azospirillaceae bacterium]